MSTTFQIGCATCKEHLWIAQSGGSTSYTVLAVYADDRRTMTALDMFLEKHRSKDVRSPEHVLVFAASEAFWAYDEWKELDPGNVQGVE